MSDFERPPGITYRYHKKRDRELCKGEKESNPLDSLKKMSAPEAKVLRNGQFVKIPASSDNGWRYSKS